MASPNPQVESTVPKVDNAVAVGADLQFQRRWWRFEHVAWALLTIYIVLDLLGAFGRGYLAKAHRRTNDGALDVTYERIERRGAPSILTVQFGDAAIHEGKVRLWVSNTLVKALGNQRVVPQPAQSDVGPDGILYTFPATTQPAFAQFALTPASIGKTKLILRVPGFDEIRTSIFAMP
jgi:hypothetical protein